MRESVFFVDRSSGKYELPDGLRALGLKVERHDDHFSADTPDIDWIAACGINGWIVVSSDRNIKRNVLEQRAILNAGVAAFFFTSANLTSVEQIEIVKKALQRVAKVLVTQQRPFIARLSRQGDVELWLNAKGEDLMAKRR